MIKDCCKDEENLRVIEQAADRIVKRCDVCGCRHFRVTLESAVTGVVPSEVNLKR